MLKLVKGQAVDDGQKSVHHIVLPLTAGHDGVGILGIERLPLALDVPDGHAWRAGDASVDELLRHPALQL